MIGGEGIYEISNLGRVRSLARTIINRGAEQKLDGKVLSPRLNKGYPRVTLRLNGKTLYRFCHKLVAEAFIGPCPKGMEVRHKNGDRSNPRLDNIEYGTRDQNIADCKIHGTFKNGASHLTKELVREIAQHSSETNSALALKYGVSTGTIANIRLGRTWKKLKVARGKVGPRQGSRHPFASGRPLMRGEAHKLAKLTENQVREIIASRQERASEIAKRLGVSDDTIRKIWNGKLWKHLPRT